MGEEEEERRREEEEERVVEKKKGATTGGGGEQKKRVPIWSRPPMTHHHQLARKKITRKFRKNSQRDSQQCKTRLWLFRIWSSRKHSVRLSRKLRPRCDAMRWRCDARKRTRGATGKCNVEDTDNRVWRFCR